MEFNSERAKLKINSIAIGTYLEPELVNVISQALPNLSIVYEPEILPPPRYKCDHSAPARELTDKELNKWLAATSNVDAYFDFDWYKPSEMIKRNPNVKWIQATSAGIGSFMKRSGLDLEDSKAKKNLKATEIQVQGVGGITYAQLVAVAKALK